MSMQSTPPHESPHAVPPTRHQPRHGPASKRRSRAPLWAGLGAVVVLASAAVAGTMLRTEGLAPASSAPALPSLGLPEAAPVPDPPLPSAAAGPTGAEQVFEGTGDDVVRLDQPVNLGVVRFECPRCTRTTTVVSDAGIDTYVVQHLSGGPYSGRRWIGVRGDTTTRFDVTAQGPWRLTVGGVDLARPVDGTTTVTGTGDDVVLMQTASRKAELTHTGESNFVVHLVTDRARSGPDLLVNEIGRYSGTVELDVVPGEAALMQVSGDGNWTFTPR